jgi:hypothetical protein
MKVYKILYQGIGISADGNITMGGRLPGAANKQSGLQFVKIPSKLKP